MIVKGVVRSRIDGVRGTVELPPYEVVDDPKAEDVAKLLEEAREQVRTMLDTSRHLPVILTVTFRP